MTDPILSRAPLRLLAAVALGLSLSLSAAVVNDGTTTNNLARISNANGVGDAVTDLEVVQANGTLRAVQSGLSFFALETVWYATSAYATNGVYSVSGSFMPEQVTADRVGGVAGWLNLVSSNGIIFQVIPEDSFNPRSFQLAVVDFTARNGLANVSANHLFDLDGTPAIADFGSTWSDLGTNYTATNFATFQLEFSVPTAADLAALSNATAHVKAKVFQTPQGGPIPLQTGTTIEVLTDLPLPGGTAHRFGYSAVWLQAILPGEGIGFLDDLTATGGIGVPPNEAPIVNITSPSNGASFTAPASITISADATDSDSGISRVDFFAGTTLLGTTNNAPYALSWTGVPVGAYSLTAVATDPLGLSTTSAPVSITVTQSSGTGPQITMVINGGLLELSWGTTGYQLQMKPDLSSTLWTDVGNTVNTNRAAVTITGGDMYFRLVQVGGPGGPTLTIVHSGNTVTLSWPANVTGYRLQATTSLSAPSWVNIPAPNNTASETITGTARFYRLINP
jgi:hypothetical protein